MAFLTGVDLETILPGIDALALARQKRAPRRRPQLELEDGGYQLCALGDKEKPVEYNQLLKSAVQLSGPGGEDPLEELRRRIKRTRGKMDAQNQMMDGFLGEVRQMKASDRSFSAAELSSPRTTTGTAALTNGQSSKALCAGSSGTELVKRRPDRPSSASRSGRPSSASNSGAVRTVSLRSDAAPARRLGESRSTPALTAAATGSLHQSAAPLALPQRRAPPGAANSELQRDISCAQVARRRALAANAAAPGGRPGSGMAKRFSHIGSSPLIA